MKNVIIVVRSVPPFIGSIARLTSSSSPPNPSLPSGGRLMTYLGAVVFCAGLMCLPLGAPERDGTGWVLSVSLMLAGMMIYRNG